MEYNPNNLSNIVPSPQLMEWATNQGIAQNGGSPISFKKLISAARGLGSNGGFSGGGIGNLISAVRGSGQSLSPQESPQNLQAAPTNPQASAAATNYDPAAYYNTFYNNGGFDMFGRRTAENEWYDQYGRVY